MFLAITALSLRVSEEWRSSENETMEPKMCNTVKSAHSLAARKTGHFQLEEHGRMNAKRERQSGIMYATNDPVFGLILNAYSLCLFFHN
jgi:hypothetical protein